MSRNEFHVGDLVTIRYSENGIERGTKCEIEALARNRAWLVVVQPGSNHVGKSFFASIGDIEHYYPPVVRDSMKAIEERKKETKIKSVTLNLERGITTVVFKDGTHKIATCAEEDTYDPAIGIALAMAYEAFGSKTKFHKYVDSIVEKSSKKKKKEKTDSTEDSVEE